jgi:amino acid permease
VFWKTRLVTYRLMINGRRSVDEGEPDRRFSRDDGRMTSLASVDNLFDENADLMEHKRLATNLSSFANMTNTVVGAGVLGLPYAFSKTGFLMGPLLLLIAACYAWNGLHLIACTCAKTGFPANLRSVSKSVHKRLPLVFDGIIALNTFGSGSAYLIVIGDLMPVVCAQLGAGGVWLHRNLWVFVGFSIAAPFTFPHELDFLKYTSAACIIFIIYVALAITFFAIPGVDNPCENQMLDDDGPCQGDHVLYEGVTAAGTLSVLSIFVFGYGCHISSFPVVSEIRKATVQNLDRVFASSLAAASVIYFLVAVCGYLTYGEMVRSNILLNYPAKGAMTIARLMVSFVVTFSYPLQANPHRRSVMTILRSLLDEEGEEPSLRVTRMRYMTVTVCYLAATLLVGQTVSDLGKVIEVMGATGGTTIMFIMPSTLYLYHFPVRGSDTDVKEKLLDVDGEATQSVVIPHLVGLDGDTDHLVRDMPVPEATQFWRRMAWFQLVSGCILMPTALIAIFAFG